MSTTTQVGQVSLQDVLSVLTKAKRKISSYEHWCVGARARRRDDTFVPETSRFACRWSARGAIGLAVSSGKYAESVRVAAIELLDAAAKAGGLMHVVVERADDRRSKRKHRQVLDVFAAAIANGKRQLQAQEMGSNHDS